MDIDSKGNACEDCEYYGHEGIENKHCYNCVIFSQIHGRWFSKFKKKDKEEEEE